jgi:hypothetical protein
MLSEQKLDPFSLPPGTRVGPWKVKAFEGGGAYGLVFRAVRVGDETAGEVALKVACYPEDERFQREVTLLSRVDHPSVPRLLDHGQLQRPGGRAHPYLVMAWVFDHAWCISSQVSFPEVRVAGQRRSCCSRSLRRRVSSLRSA